MSSLYQYPPGVDPKILMRYLREVRESKGLRQFQLAALLGISQNALCQWELGNVRVPAGMLERILKILNVSLAKAMDGAGCHEDGS